MKLVIMIGSLTRVYYTIKNIAFSPEVDVMSSQLIVDGFEMDVVTDDEISVGRKCYLRTEDNNLFADFYITHTQRVEPKVVHVRAKSELLYLDKKTMKAKFYDNMAFDDVLTDIVGGTPARVHTQSQELLSQSITGYAPKQTARERLLWLLFATGGYARTSFGSGADILYAGSSTGTIKYEHTYWKPKVTYEDYVTSIIVTAYSFDQRTPLDDEEYVKVGSNKYVVESMDFTLTNPDAPSTAPENTVQFTDCMFVSTDNVNDILNRLAGYYFNRMEVELDCINNELDYLVGNKYNVSLDLETMVQGYCTKSTYSFGNQTKSTMIIKGATNVQSGHLIVTYKSVDNPPGDIVVGEKKYTFPVGYQVTLDNEWIDTVIGNNRYVFRPTSATTTVTIGLGENKVTVNCKVCLVHNLKSGVLKIVSVDGVTRTSSTSGGKTVYTAEVD